MNFPLVGNLFATSTRSLERSDALKPELNAQPLADGYEPGMPPVLTPMMGMSFDMPTPQFEKPAGPKMTEAESRDVYFKTMGAMGITSFERKPEPPAGSSDTAPEVQDSSDHDIGYQIGGYHSHKSESSAPAPQERKREDEKPASSDSFWKDVDEVRSYFKDDSKDGYLFSGGGGSTGGGGASAKW